MKKLLMITVAVVVATILGSCSKDVELMNMDDMQKIGFSSISNNTVSELTRSNVVTTKDGVESFNVWGFLSNGGAQYVGDNATTGVQINKVSGSWDYANSNDVAYWPNEALNFYAVTPLNNANGGNTISANIANDAQKVTVTVPEDVKLQNDVMVATAANQKKGSTVTDETVHLTFAHILSQIVFKANTTSKKLTVNVNSLSVCNVKNQGDYDFTNWTLAGENKNYAIGMEKTSVNYNNTVNLTNEKGALLLIPQELNPVNVEAGSKVFTESNDSYLKIDCEIAYSDVELHRGVLYVPFKANWTAGKKYIYTLQFGGGYDDDGNEILTPIKYTVEEVEGWVEETSIE